MASRNETRIMNVVITGGAGFIGSNCAAYYIKKGAGVVVFDNLSRRCTDKNIEWLHKLGGDLTFIKGDVRFVKDIDVLTPHIEKADAIFHFAAQVAVTSSVLRPEEDFEINALGTIRLLEKMRVLKSKAKLIYSSTNKVYGDLEEMNITKTPTRYDYISLPHGIHEQVPLDFYSPYGCSKGSADQYVHDYARIYGLDTVVMRQSCIYGPRQFGIEDQGWVAWFVIAAITGKPLTIYGDGRQVRDLLYVDDLIEAYDMAVEKGSQTRGKIYNIGGGPANSISIWHEFAPFLKKLTGKDIQHRFAQTRPGDQKIFISDTRKATKEFGWQPHTDIETGLARLYSWISDNVSLFL